MNNINNKPFSFLKDIEPSILADHLKDEDLNIIKLILSFTEPDYLAKVLLKFSDEKRLKLTIAIATIKDLNSLVVKKVEDELKKELNIYNSSNKIQKSEDTTWLVARALNSMGHKAADILHNINALDPNLAHDIKKDMFMFEDIFKLSDMDRFRLMNHIKIDELVIVLKNSSKEKVDKFTSMMSLRGRERFEEEFEKIGQVSLKKTESSQEYILDVALRLLEIGEIEREEY